MAGALLRNAWHDHHARRIVPFESGQCAVWAKPERVQIMNDIMGDEGSSGVWPEAGDTEIMGDKFSPLPGVTEVGGGIAWQADAYRAGLQSVGISVEKIPERMLDLLNQDEWWRPLNKPPVRLVDMDVSHRRNLIGWLERRAVTFHFMEGLRYVLIAGSPMGPSGDMACDAFDAESAEHDRQDPKEWLNARPLMQKLRELQPPEKQVEGLDLDWEAYYG